MPVIDVFCEDVDFPSGTAPSVTTSNGNFRAGFARCALASPGGFVVSTPFAGITSGWLSAQVFFPGNNSNPDNPTLGLGSVGTSSGLFLGLQYGQGTPTLYSVVNGAKTVLARAANAISYNALHKVDLQLINYGANGTLNLYIDGALSVSYTGNIAIAGITNLTGVFIGVNGAFALYVSEVIVADESTLGWQGIDLREVTANGTTQQWSNPAYTNFNPIIINDANSTYSNTAGQDEQAILANSVTGNFAIKAVKIVARANAPAGSAVTNLKLGLRNGAGVVGVGTAHALTTAFAPVSDLLTIDPTTGQPFTSIDGYQLDLRSA